MMHVDDDDLLPPPLPVKHSLYARFGKDFDPLRAVESFDALWIQAGSQPSRRVAVIRMAVAIILTRDVAHRIVKARGGAAAASFINAIYEICQPEPALGAAFTAAAQFAVKFLGACAPSDLHPASRKVYTEIAGRENSRMLAAMSTMLRPGQAIVADGKGYKIVARSGAQTGVFLKTLAG